MGYVKVLVCTMRAGCDKTFATISTFYFGFVKNAVVYIPIFYLAECFTTLIVYTFEVVSVVVSTYSMYVDFKFGHQVSLNALCIFT